MKQYTTDQLVEIIDRSLKKTAEDVRLGRVPRDGRARMPKPFATSRTTITRLLGTPPNKSA
jgi:hypothetical protein